MDVHLAQHSVPLKALGSTTAFDPWVPTTDVSAAGLGRQQLRAVPGFNGAMAATQQQRLPLGCSRGAQQQHSLPVAASLPTAAVSQQAAYVPQLGMPSVAAATSAMVQNSQTMRSAASGTDLPLLPMQPASLQAPRIASRTPKLGTVQTYNPATGVRTLTSAALAAHTTLAPAMPASRPLVPMAAASQLLTQQAQQQREQYNQNQLLAALQAIAYGNGDDALPAQGQVNQLCTLPTATKADVDGEEDMESLCRCIGTDLARHGIPVATAIEAGWLGRVSPSSAAAIGQAYAEEQERIRRNSPPGPTLAGKAGLPVSRHPAHSHFGNALPAGREPSSVLNPSQMSSYDDGSAGSVSSVALDDFEPLFDARGGSFHTNAPSLVAYAGSSDSTDFPLRAQAAREPAIPPAAWTLHSLEAQPLRFNMQQPLAAASAINGGALAPIYHFADQAALRLSNGAAAGNALPSASTNGRFGVSGDALSGSRSAELADMLLKLNLGLGFN